MAPGAKNKFGVPTFELLRSFGSKCTVLKICANDIVVTFWPPAVIRRPGNCAPCPSRYIFVVMQ